MRRFLATRSRDSFWSEVFLVQRVQGREGRETSREADTGPRRATLWQCKDLEGDRNYGKEKSGFSGRDRLRN